MSPSYPSIQSFYGRETTSSQTLAQIPSDPHPPACSSSTPIQPGDGFTEDELAEATDPMTRKWNPSREYAEKEISELIRGPQAVMIVGRIVNFSEVLGKAATQPKARGWHHILVRDDSGVLQVKLYFSHKPYPFRIGHLVTIWTTFVSDATSITNVTRIPDAPMATSIFPGRDTSVHIMVHLKSDTGEMTRAPLGCQGTKPLPGLMTLKSFVQGGHEVENSKILVCVKSVGPRKTINLKNGATNDLVEVHIFDDTDTNKLCLWGVLTDTGKEWISNATILLITNPIFKFDSRGNGWGNVSLTSASMIDVNPQFRDVDWLRNFAANIYKKECVKQEFPRGLWNADAAVNAQLRIAYSLAEIDRTIHANPGKTFTGFTSLTLTSTNLVLLRSRNMLLLNECCGVPIYGITTSSICKNCSTDVTLSLNPKVIGALVDETGQIASGKLLWRDGAWEDLFGREVKRLVELTAGELRLLEQRMCWLRFTFVWGWSESVGKLAILAVRE